MLKELKEDLENRRNTNKGKIKRNQILELKTTVTKMEKSVDSEADVNRRNKESANTKIGQ